MKTIRLGIIGCGEVSQIIHLPSLLFLAEKFRVTAICDVSLKVLKTVGQQWQIPKGYTDYRQLMEEADTEAILIANPNVYHTEAILAAVEAGKHVLVEKPMCMTLEEADRIMAAQEKAGTTVQVGYMRRYAPAFLKGCQLVKKLGRIRLARVHDVLGQNALFIKNTSRVVRGDDVPEEIVSAGQQLWAQKITEAIGDTPPEQARAYGLMLGLSSHDISAMREMIGLPEKIIYTALRSGGLYISAAFDYGDYICHYETGINNIPKFDAHLEIYGQEKILRVVYDTPYVRNLPIRLFTSEANKKGGVTEYAEHPEWGDAFVAEWLAFYDNINSGTMPKTSPADFRKDLVLFRDMIEASRKYSRTGKND